MLEIDFVGAEVLRPDDWDAGTLSIAGGQVVDGLVGRQIDLSGYRLLPGIIDVHGDGFERHLAPRRGAMKQMGEGLVAVDAELAANGITTAVLAQFVSWEGGIRGPDFAEQVFTSLLETRRSLVTDIRAQLRFEIHLTDLYPDIVKHVGDWGVGYVVFNDHLPHDRLSAGRKPPGLVGQALKAGRNPDVHFQMLLDLHARSGEVEAKIDQVTRDLHENGVRMGSHDDSTAEARDVWRARGVTIAEFPETLEAAEAARAGRDHIVLGSPNLVRGGSHKGNASAIDLVIMGLCDALASDYHYPSPRRAALMLAKSGVLDFPDAWALVSSGPARVLGLKDRGKLVPGQRADIVILDAQDRVAATFSGGQISYLSGAIAERFWVR